MTVHPTGPGELHAPQPQRAVVPLGRPGVHVGADSGARQRCCRTVGPRPRGGRGAGWCGLLHGVPPLPVRQVGGGGDLGRPGVPGDGHHRLPQLLHEQGVVSGRGAGPHGSGVGPGEHLPTEALRRLHRSQGRPRGGAGDAVLVVDHLDGVHHRERRDGARGPSAHRIDHPAEDLGRGEASGCVVHQDEVHRIGQAGQTRGDRVGALGPAGHHGGPVRARAARRRPEQLRRTVLPAGRRHHHHLTHPLAREQAVEGVLEQRGPVDLDERLGQARPQPGAGTRRDDDDPDGSAAVGVVRGHGVVQSGTLSSRGPRRGSPRRAPRRSSPPERARRPGSGGPWRACASHPRTDPGPAHGATGRGRPRPP